MKFLYSILFMSFLTITLLACNTFNFSNNLVLIGKKTHEKHVKLMKLDQNRIPRNKLAWFLVAEKDYANGIVPFINSSTSIDLGMSNVPTLDQGEEGTCVTFSTTAALDALGNLGDLISQQCSLALDINLRQNYWNGADYPSQIIQPLKQYGVISHAACPSSYPDLNQNISTSAYEALADSNGSKVAKAVNFVYYSTPNLQNLKNSLKEGKRVLLAISIDANYQQAIQGFDIKVNGVQKTGGLWACKQGQSANYCGQSLDGHEVLVTGYDDKQQLLKIRNSWGVEMGECGNYYMTYDFFNAMAVDMTVISD